MNTQGWNRYSYASNGPLKFMIRQASMTGSSEKMV